MKTAICCEEPAPQGQNRFEEVGIALQYSAKNFRIARERFDRSCAACDMRRRQNTDCCGCPIRKAHLLAGDRMWSKLTPEDHMYLEMERSSVDD